MVRFKLQCRWRFIVLIKIICECMRRFLGTYLNWWICFFDASSYTWNHKLTKKKVLAENANTLKRREKRKLKRGGTEEIRSVTVAVARSKTLLCKLTLRVCIAGSERENGGRAGRRDEAKKTEKEEIQRQRAERSIKRGDRVDRREGWWTEGTGVDERKVKDEVSQ